MSEHGESAGSIPRGARPFFVLKGHVIRKLIGRRRMKLPLWQCLTIDRENWPVWEHPSWSRRCICIRIFYDFIGNFYGFFTPSRGWVPRSTHRLPFLGRLGTECTHATPIFDVFGPPTRPRIGRNRYPTLTGIFRGPLLEWELGSGWAKG